MVIQRVQTLYLLLAAVCSVVFIFIPFAYSGDMSLTPSGFTAMWVLLAASAAVSLIDIFLFKTPGLQKALIVVACLLLVAAAVMVFVEVSSQSLTLGGGGLLIVASLIGLVAAYRGICADQKLLRSLDRIR